MSFLFFYSLVDSLYSTEISEAAAHSNGQSLRRQNARSNRQYPCLLPSTSSQPNSQMSQHESMIMSPMSPSNNRNDQSKSIHIDEMGETEEKQNNDKFSSHFSIYII